MVLHVDNEDSENTKLMPRLIGDIFVTQSHICKDLTSLQECIDP